MKKSVFLACTLTAVFIFIKIPAYGNIAISIEEVGDNLVVSYSGTLNTTEFSAFTAGNSSSQMLSSSGFLRFTGGGDYNLTVNNPWETAPAEFGSSDSIITADSVSGDNFSVSSSWISYGTSYTSGSIMSGTMTFLNERLSSFGISSDFLTTGTLISGDTVTVQAIPEPASALLMSMTVGVCLFIRRTTLRA